ncbi:MAG TPA: hypothetical protein VJ867_03750 [Gemmatimonadaceae bacterium]|nr:hypothetical protein [Gemmatimonadaceae bacterium]
MTARIRVLVAGVAYGVVGLATAALAARGATTFWRLTAWALSAAVIVVHLWLAYRERRVIVRSAAEVAAGAAVGGFLLALGGPVRSHWGAAGQGRALASLIAFPAFMAIAAFVAALLFAAVLPRRAA